ncbi:MAG: hypothetical protein IID36_07985, partial [Planctomycetes bacterium]|nr:hypothetical protein [Planctomycetota bacterium]
MTTQRILAWADAHYKRTGRWPTYRSGPVFDVREEDWSAIDGCLVYGGLGLPGGSSLNFLLARHRGFISGKARAKLSIKVILVWADRHHIRTGEWPTQRSGPIKGVRGESWRKIDVALRVGHRGLGDGSSLAQLLAKHRGRVLGLRCPNLKVSEILTWADRYRRRDGRWPNRSAGPIEQVPGETWGAIDNSLKTGGRGLPRGGSLARLLVEHRGAVIARHKKPLTIEGVLTWADRRKKRTGAWPTAKSGAVEGVEGETWMAINACLHYGRRGLPGSRSLSLLLGARRGK